MSKSFSELGFDAGKWFAGQTGGRFASRSFLEEKAWKATGEALWTSKPTPSDCAEYVDGFVKGFATLREVV